MYIDEYSHSDTSIFTESVTYWANTPGEEIPLSLSTLVITSLVSCCFRNVHGHRYLHRMYIWFPDEREMLCCLFYRISCRHFTFVGIVVCKLTSYRSADARLFDKQSYLSYRFIILLSTKQCSRYTFKYVQTKFNSIRVKPIFN